MEKVFKAIVTHAFCSGISIFFELPQKMAAMLDIALNDINAVAVSLILGGIVGWTLILIWPLKKNIGTTEVITQKPVISLGGKLKDSAIMGNIYGAHNRLLDTKGDVDGTVISDNAPLVYDEASGKISKCISRIYNDLIENWDKNGLQAQYNFLGLIEPPEAHNCRQILYDYSIDLTVPEDIRNDLKQFLGYFVYQKTPLEAVSNGYWIRTIFKIRKTLNKHKPKIKKLAESLSERLKHVEC